MSVLTCGERPDQREAEHREDGSRLYRRVYLVTTSSKLDGPIAVLRSPELPMLFDAYNTGRELDSEALCIGRRPRQISPTCWEVEVEYDSKLDDTSKKNKQDPNENPRNGNPDEWGAKVGVSFENIQKPVDHVLEAGLAGDAGPYMLPADIQAKFRGCVNSANEPFDPPPMYDVAVPILTFTIFRKAFNWQVVGQFVNAVNADPFFGANQRQFRITQISTGGPENKTINERTIWYYPITIEMKYAREGWDLTVLDQGSYYLDTGAKKAFATEDGQPYIGLLDGAGGKLADGAKAVFRVFRVYTEIAFAGLGLPDRMPRF